MIHSLRSCHALKTLLDAVIGRHFVMDEVLVHEIAENGAQQLVILGAGYDSRALRFAPLLTAHGVEVFEVDLASTQREKRAVLQRNNIEIPKHLRFVAVDFGRDDTRQLLVQHGYDAAKQTVFILEGVAPYISAQELRAPKS